LAGDALPARQGLVEGSQSFVFPADPADQVGVDARQEGQEGIQRGAVLIRADLADDGVIRLADDRSMGRPRLLVAGWAFVCAVTVFSAE
jgi:hypothetical protein